jgi:hypothetical protein
MQGKIIIGNRPFDSVAQFELLEHVRDESCIREEINRRLHSGGACYDLRSVVFCVKHSIQIFISVFLPGLFNDT